MLSQEALVLRALLPVQEAQVHHRVPAARLHRVAAVHHHRAAVRLHRVAAVHLLRTAALPLLSAAAHHQANETLR